MNNRITNDEVSEKRRWEEVPAYTVAKAMVHTVVKILPSSPRSLPAFGSAYGDQGYAVT